MKNMFRTIIAVWLFSLSMETNKCKNSILVKLKKEAEHGNRQVTIASNFYMEYNSDIVYKAIDDLRKDGYKISTAQSPSKLFTVSF